MNLWLSLHLLLAGLLVSQSAPTPEECGPLIAPLSLDDPSVMYGRTNLMLGYTDNKMYNDILRHFQSLWLTVDRSPSSPETHFLREHSKIKGTCLRSRVNVTIEGNKGSAPYLNSTSEFQILPGTNSSIVFSLQITFRNMDKFMKMLNIASNVTGEDMNVRAVYLAARETTLKDSDGEHFMKQASCLGFSGEPDYTYDPQHAFCAEGEGPMMLGTTSMDISK